MFFLIIIVSFLIFNFLIQLLSNYLNFNSITHTIPDDFVDILDDSKYIKSQEYTKANIYFQIISSTFSLAITLLIILGGGFNILDQFIRSLSINSEIVLGLLFFLIFFLFNDFISLPLQYYKNFVIEQKFGFNKMTKQIFITDKIKSYILMILIGGPILAFIIYFFNSFPQYGWFYVWILLATFSIILQPLFIIFIAPLFNKFTPLEDGELRNKIEVYLHSVKFPVANLDVMDGSKRSAHSNAYFSGFGTKKRIALFDTLLNNHSDEEIISIIAHEVAHYKKRHIIKNMIFSILYSGVVLFILSYFLNYEALFDAFKMEQTSVYASLLFFSILYSPIDFILSIILNKISRIHEFEADRFSIDTYKDKDNLINALKKLSISNLGNLTPHPFTVVLNYTHPPIIHRLRAIKSA